MGRGASTAPRVIFCYTCPGVPGVVQQKSGRDVHISLHPELKALIDRLALDNVAFLVASNGKPFVLAGFMN